MYKLGGALQIADHSYGKRGFRLEENWFWAPAQEIMAI